MEETFTNLSEFKFTGNGSEDVDFLSGVKNFIADKKNKVGEKIALIKRYDRATGFETFGNSNQEIIENFLNEVTNG